MTANNVDFEKIEGDNDSADTEDFSVIIESLRQKAKIVNTMLEWTEQRDAITEIGEDLKEIMISEYFDLLTNNTFSNNELSVVITEYPLNENRTLRKIDYSLKLNDPINGVPREEKRFFLQFHGETVFFSDINYTESSEKEFFVFENTEGCFAFSLLDYYTYTTFSTNESITEYRANVYIPQDNGFTVEHFIDIPIKIISSDSLQLIQGNNTIKTYISNPDNSLTCVFNSKNISFEPMKGEIKSSYIDYDIPGLLLGLSDSKGNMRTLFVYKEDGRIKVDEYSNQIIFSRKDKLFSIKHYTFEKDFYGNEFENETDYITGAMDIKKLLCSPIDVESGGVFEDILNSYTGWGYYNNLDIPLYIGEEYICYIQNSFHSGGGTLRLSPSRIRFDKLNNLSDFVYDENDWVYGGLIPSFDEETLADLIYGRKTEDFYQSNISTYGGEMNPYIDFTQLSLKRNGGKWGLMLPLMSEYYHPGNGSYSNWIKTFAVYSNDVPSFLNTKDESIELGGWNKWNAKDFFKFPDSNAALFQYDYFIGVCSLDYNPWESEDYDVLVNTNIDEYIVAISFPNSATHETWIDELSRIQ